jgi:hypothetical protein
MGKVQFTFLSQVLGISDPVAGFAGTGRLIVAQLAVQGFNEFNAFPQRIAERFCSLVINASEVLQAFGPLTQSLTVAVMAALAGRRVEALMREISLFDELLYQQLRKSKRFN